MENGPAEGLFHQYRRLIKSAAVRFSSRFISGIEFDDMFQDGCTMMLEFFNGRAHTKDLQVHNTFKKSLFLWMLRTRNRAVEIARPNGYTMVRLAKSGGVALIRELNYKNDHDANYDADDDDVINLDQMLGTMDACVLMKMYAEEFVAELRRMLTGLNLTIFDVMIGFVDNPGGCGDMVREAVRKSGVSTYVVYNHIRDIRDVVRTVMSRSA